MEKKSNADILNLFYFYGEYYNVLERIYRVFNKRHFYLQLMTKTKFKGIESNFLRLEKVKVAKNIPIPIPNHFRKNWVYTKTIYINLKKKY